MIKPSSIRISERIAENLATRRAADELFDFVQASPYKRVTLDFKSVKFASRSFAHEYMMRKAEISKKVIEKNVPVSVKKMFKIVSEQGVNAPHAAESPFSSMSLSAKNL